MRSTLIGMVRSRSLSSSEGVRVNTSEIRIGKMPVWLKKLTYILGGVCFLSGLIWVVLDDLLNYPFPMIRQWIKFHGVVGQICILLIGMAMYKHVQVCLSVKRNQWCGGLFLASALIVVVSILFLFYGQEAFRLYVRLIHIGMGILSGVLFVVHIYIGRKSSWVLPKIKSKLT